MKIDVIPTGTEPYGPTVFPLNGQGQSTTQATGRRPLGSSPDGRRGVPKRGIKLWPLLPSRVRRCVLLLLLLLLLAPNTVLSSGLCSPARRGGVPLHAVRRGQHPGGLRLHQRRPPEHLRPRGGGAGGAKGGLHRRGRLQVGTDQDQVGAGGLPGQRRHQGEKGRKGDIVV